MQTTLSCRHCSL